MLCVSFTQTRSRSLENGVDEMKNDIIQLKGANEALVAEKAAAIREIDELKEKSAKLVSFWFIKSLGNEYFSFRRKTKPISESR